MDMLLPLVGMEERFLLPEADQRFLMACVVLVISGETGNEDPKAVQGLHSAPLQVVQSQTGA